MEWQSKLHDKEQEIKIIIDKFEKKIKSFQVELEEKNSDLEMSRDSTA